MDKLVRLVAEQESAATNYRLYSELPEVLREPSKTHPKQIAQKASKQGIHFTKDEWIVYKTIQGMFNAKPDLVLAVGNYLIVFEAKLTEIFKEDQLLRT